MTTGDEIRANIEAVGAQWAAEKRAQTAPERPRKARVTKWLESAFHGAVDEVRTQREPGRNHCLNAVAYKLGRCVNPVNAEGCTLEASRIERELLRACTDNGLIHDDGDRQCRATIRSGLEAGMNDPRDLSDVGNLHGQHTGSGFNNGADNNNAAAYMIAGRTFDTVKDDVPTWIWEYEGHGRIQMGTLTVFAGRPGAGKSFATRWFAAQLSRGTLEGIWHHHPVNIALLALEEQDEYTVKPSLRAVNADMTRIYRPYITCDGKDVPILAIRDEDRLRDWLIDRQIRVLIVDPIMATFDRNMNINANNEVRAYLQPYSRLAQAIKGAVIGVAHLKKAQTDDLVAGITGSSAFGEIPRAIFGFARKPDTDEHVMSQHKNSAGRLGFSVTYTLTPTNIDTDSGLKTEMVYFDITGDSDITVEDMMMAGEVNAHGKIQACTIWLRDLLEIESYLPQNAIAKLGAAEGFNERMLYRAASKIGVVFDSHSETGKPRIAYWRLKNSQPVGGWDRPSDNT